jgi:hypothetical protein
MPWDGLWAERIEEVLKQVLVEGSRCMLTPRFTFSRVLDPLHGILRALPHLESSQAGTRF